MENYVSIKYYYLNLSYIYFLQKLILMVYLVSTESLELHFLVAYYH